MKPELVAKFQSALAGRYTIDRELGRGGMATVFLAHDRDGAEVALKLLNPDLGSTIGADRFRREIRVATQLAGDPGRLRAAASARLSSATCARWASTRSAGASRAARESAR